MGNGKIIIIKNRKGGRGESKVRKKDERKILETVRIVGQTFGDFWRLLDFSSIF